MPARVEIAVNTVSSLLTMDSNVASQDDGGLG